MWAQAQAVAADAARARAELARAHRKRANARSPLRARSARRKQPGGPDLASVAEAREDRMAATAAASAAVAAGTGADAAVAATRADLDAMRVTQPFKMNNTALKWIRDSHEQPPGFPTAWMVDLTDTDPMDIGVLDRNTGMAYSFKDGETQPWSWRQMLAAFKPEVLEKVLGSHPAVGVQRITCEAIDAYDHKRWHAARHVGRPFARDAPVPVWDFVVTRTDGVTTRFHTSFTTNKVEIATAGTGLVLPGPPLAGKGKSDGPGTYKRHTAGNYDASFRGTGKGSAVADPRDAQGGAPAQADAPWPRWHGAAGAEAQQAEWGKAKAAWWEQKQEPASPAGGWWSGADWWGSGWGSRGAGPWGSDHGGGAGGASGGASGSTSSSAAGGASWPPAASTDARAQWQGSGRYQ